MAPYYGQLTMIDYDQLGRETRVFLQIPGYHFYFLFSDRCVAIPEFTQNFHLFDLIHSPRKIDKMARKTDQWISIMANMAGMATKMLPKTCSVSLFSFTKKIQRSLLAKIRLLFNGFLRESPKLNTGK